MTRKLSISLPDDLYEELQVEGAENVSAFVAGAVRHQLDRRRLLGFVAELEEELGPVDEDAFTEFDAVLGNVLAASATASKRRGARGSPARNHRPVGHGEPGRLRRDGSGPRLACR